MIFLRENAVEYVSLKNVDMKKEISENNCTWMYIVLTIFNQFYYVLKERKQDRFNLMMIYRIPQKKIVYPRISDISFNILSRDIKILAIQKNKEIGKNKHSKF